jgi:uncharacterized membrane protein
MPELQLKDEYGATAALSRLSSLLAITCSVLITMSVSLQWNLPLHSILLWLSPIAYLTAIISLILYAVKTMKRKRQLRCWCREFVLSLPLSRYHLLVHYCPLASII